MPPLKQRKMRILVVGSSDSHECVAIMQLLSDPQGVLGDEPAKDNKIPAYEYETTHAASFEEGLAAFASFHPDLVLVSVAKGSLHLGGDLCQKIRSREDQRHTGVIFFLTGGPVDDDMLPVECLELGADDFFGARISQREILARINSVLRLKAMTDELRSANHKLEILSLTDELTGLHNMRSFNIHYSDMIRRCRQGEFGLGVIMLDLDYFKSVNDQANHLVGSHVISEVGKIIRYSGLFGMESCAARYGGDEYILCLQAHDIYEVCQKAERLRGIIAEAEFQKDGYNIKLTSSIGVSWIDPGFDGKADDPIKAADVMLYKSKEEGRNQVQAMILRYPVDFNHVGRSHLVDWNAGGDYNHIPRTNNF